MSKTKPTLEDIAKEAEVSSCLVSKIINGKVGGSLASEATRAKILEIAKRLNYKPNIAAQRLAGASRDAIGVFFDHDRDFIHPFHSMTLHEIIVRAEALGYSVNVGMAGTGDKLKLLEKGVIDSAILCHSSAHNSEELGRKLAAASVPTVFLNPGKPLEFNAVACDDKGGIDAAFDYLKSLGHQPSKIAFLSGPSLHGSHELRVARIRELGGSYLPVPPRTTALDAKAALENCDVTALLVPEDSLQAVYMACHSLGMEIPEDLSVISIDEPASSALYLPEPTAINVPILSMADRAVEMLDALIKNGKGIPSVELPENLSLRASCATPRNP